MDQDGNTGTTGSRTFIITADPLASARR